MINFILSQLLNSIGMVAVIEWTITVYHICSALFCLITLWLRSFIWGLFTDFRHGCFTGTKAIVWLPIRSIWHIWHISQISQCNCPIYQHAPFCNRNVHMCAHFCFTMVHCGMFVWCMVGFGGSIDWQWKNHAVYGVFFPMPNYNKRQ